MASVTLDPRFRSDIIFNDLSRQFITLKDAEMQEYNIHLRTVLNAFIEEMKKKDPIFKACFQRIAYVGSYYEGLKVGKPEEFDLNIIINLPIDYSTLQVIIAPERPGYIKLKGTPDMLEKLQKHVRWTEYKGMEKWIDRPNMYLDQNKFRQWFESVSTRALGSFEYVGGKYVLNANGKKYLLNHKKSGPAWTLKIDVPGGHIVDVDLVPALEFSTPPPKPFKNHNTKKQNWFTISKPLDGPSSHILWRPSFYEREQEILKGSMKQVIRQMKKLRDTQNFKSIASYYIKTLFLRESENLTADFERFPSTFKFYYMLRKLQEACAKHEIYDFWNPKNNLLGNIGKDEMSNISYRLIRILKDIDRKITEDPYVIAEFILTKDELEQLKGMRLLNGMASMSLGVDKTQQSPQSEGIGSGFWNSFWRTGGEPALQ